MSKKSISVEELVRAVEDSRRLHESPTVYENKSYRPLTKYELAKVERYLKRDAQRWTWERTESDRLQRERDEKRRIEREAEAKVALERANEAFAQIHK